MDWERVEQLAADRRLWVASAPLAIICALLWMGFGALPIAACIWSLFIGVKAANWVADDANGEFLAPLAEYLLGKKKEAPARSRAATEEGRRRRMPWEGLVLPSQLNESLESLLEQIVDQYINNWYAAGISRDRAFVNEIRYQLRFACARLVERLSEVDLPSVVAREAIPAASLHVHRIAHIEKSFTDKNIPISLGENRICEKLKDLHYALGSRQNEVNYLRQVADQLIPLLLDESRLAGRAHDDDSPAKHSSRRPMRPWPSHSARHFLRELLVGSILMPLLDLIANPDTLNHLIIVAFDSQKGCERTAETSPDVPFLFGLTDTAVESVPDSLLQLKLSEVLRDARQFSMFRLYLQDIRGPVNELSFLAETTRIHESMQRKEETESQISYDVWQLFGQFVHESAPDRIALDKALVAEFAAALESHDIDQLDRIVEKAFQAIYQRLQSEHMVPFCQSDSFLGYLCGSPPISIIELVDKTAAPRKSSTSDRAISFNMFRTQLRRLLTLSTEGSAEGEEVVSDELSMDSLSSAQRDRARSAGHHDVPVAVFGGPDDEEPEQPSSAPPHSQSLPHLQLPSIDIIDDDGDVSPSISIDEDAISISSAVVESESEVPVPVPTEPLLVIDRETRNMNHWRVSIGRIIPTRDSITGRTVFVYVIDIERTEAKDHETKMWSIYRRFTEFYVLEAKLVEFHRDALRFSSLPPRKTFATKNRAFMEQHRLVFAAFISSLCKQKLLYHSDLLTAFLTSPEEFRDSVMLSDLNPWKAVKKMPGKLGRERGQHLRPFLLNLLANTLAPPEKPANGGYREKIDIASDSSSLSSLSAGGGGDPPSWSLYSGVFGNNCVGCKVDEEIKGETQKWTRSPLDSLLLLAHSMLTPASRWFFNILAAVRLLCLGTFDSCCEHLLRRIQDRLVDEAVLVSLVQLIQQSLFVSDGTAATEQEKALREQLARRKVLEVVQDEIPSQVQRAVGRGSIREGASQLVHSLQYPRLNKQLSYVLVDILLSHLLPTDQSHPLLA